MTNSKKKYKTMSIPVDKYHIIDLINEARSKRPTSMTYREFMEEVLGMSHTHIYNCNKIGLRVQKKLEKIGITKDKYIKI